MSDPTPTDAEMTTDVPALLARADLVHLGRQVALVGDGDGFTTEVCGVKIAKCDDRGRTEADIRAEKAEAELAAAREALARVKALVAPQWRTNLGGEYEHTAEALAEVVRAGLRKCRVEDAPVPLIREGDLYHATHMVTAELLASPAMRDLLARERAAALREAADWCESIVKDAMGALRTDYADGWHDASANMLTEIRARAEAESSRQSPLAAPLAPERPAAAPEPHSTHDEPQEGA